MSPSIQTDVQDVAGHSQLRRDPPTQENYISDFLDDEMEDILPPAAPARQKGNAASTRQKGNAASARQKGNATPAGQGSNSAHTRESNPGHSQAVGINTLGPRTRQTNNGRSKKSNSHTQQSSSPSTNRRHESTRNPTGETKGTIHFEGDTADIEMMRPHQMLSWLHHKGLYSVLAVHKNHLKPSQFTVVAPSPLEAQTLRESLAVFQSALDGRIIMKPENFYFVALKITRDRLNDISARTGLDVSFFDDLEASLEALCRETGLDLFSAKWKEDQLIFCIRDLGQAQWAVTGDFSFTLFGIKTTFEARDPRSFVKQCSNCQGYGHMQGECPYTTKCGQCAGLHRTETCPNPHNVKCANCNGNRGHAAIDKRECPILKQAKKTCLAYRTTPEWVTRPLPTSSPVTEYPAQTPARPAVRSDARPAARPTQTVSKDVADEDDTNDPDQVSLPSSLSLIEDRLVDTVISMLEFDWSSRLTIRLLLKGATIPSGVPKKLWSKFQDTFPENPYIPASQEGISEFVPNLDTAYDSDASYKTVVNAPESRQSVNRSSRGIDAFGVEPSAASSSPGSPGNSTGRKVICISDTSTPSTPASSTNSTPKPSPTVQKRKRRQSHVEPPEPSSSGREVSCISDTSTGSTPDSSPCSTLSPSLTVREKKPPQSQIDRPERSCSLRRKRSLEQEQDGHNVQHKRPRRVTKADKMRSIARSGLNKPSMEKEPDTTPPPRRMTLRPRPASGDAAKSVSKKRKRGSKREDKEDSLLNNELEVHKPTRNTISLASQGNTDNKARDCILAKIPAGTQKTLHAFAKQGFF